MSLFSVNVGRGGHHTVVANNFNEMSLDDWKHASGAYLRRNLGHEEGPSLEDDLSFVVDVS